MPCGHASCNFVNSVHMVTPQQPTSSRLAFKLFARLRIACARSASLDCACRLYLSKLNFYRQRQWSCQVTGKHGLTYEEAATSEQKVKNATSQVSTCPVPYSAGHVGRDLKQLILGKRCLKVHLLGTLRRIWFHLSSQPLPSYLTMQAA